MELMDDDGRLMFPCVVLFFGGQIGVCAMFSTNVREHKRKFYAGVPTICAINKA